MKQYLPKIVVLFVFLFFTACIKKKDFDNSPSVSFVNYKTYTHTKDGKSIADSAYLTFHFTDGDGDLGSADSNQMTLFLFYYEDKGKGFEHLPLFDRQIFIPQLTPQGNNKGIEGTMTQIIKPGPIFNVFTPYAYQWRIQLIDQAQHKSNIAEMPSQTK